MEVWVPSDLWGLHFGDLGSRGLGRLGSDLGGSQSGSFRGSKTSNGPKNLGRVRVAPDSTGADRS